MKTPEEIRKHFPHISRGLVYFNHASIGPLSDYVTGALNEYIMERSEGPVKNFETYIRNSEGAKDKLSGLLNVNPNEISWTDNVSNAMSLLANGLNLKPGDKIILNSLEFPANIYPFLNLKRKGVLPLIIPTEKPGISLEDLIPHVDEKTRLISISLVQFLTGYRTDIREIGQFCREKNIIFAVDGIQGAGTVGLDLPSCYVDFFAGGAQKWLMALQGLSYFYVSPSLLDRIDPPNAGWSSVKDAWNLLDYNLEFQDDASKFQTGTLNVIGVVALNHSLRLLHEFGITNVEKRILDNAEYFINRLLEEGFDPLLKDGPRKNLSGIISIKIENAEKIYLAMKEQGYVAEIREGKIRFSPHFYNTFEEIDLIVGALKKNSNRNR